MFKIPRFSLPSLEAILADAAKAARRFPETLVVSVFCAGFSICISHFNGIKNLTDFYQLLSTLTLAIPLTLAIAVASDANPKQRLVIRVGGLTIGAIILALFYSTYAEGHTNLFRFRYFQLSLGFHLLVAFAPFFGRGTAQGFWQYNHKLFLRYLLAVIYSGTLQLGLSIALIAVDKLLGFHVSPKIYMDQWLTIVFVFNTWVFLAGVPDNWLELDHDTTYPPSLRIFTSFILLPIVTLYFVILYTYAAKIIFLQSWPRGTIAWLVSGASILGIFSLMLVHPLRNDTKNRWIPLYSRGFYLALYPLIILLLFAIAKRTGDYGLTERRYVIFVIAGWLTAMATYFILSRNKNIKVVPMTLCALAFLTSAGPWSAYAVSARWQKSRLIEIFQSAGAWENGKAKSPSGVIENEQQKEISSILLYFERMHGWAPVQDIFTANLETKTAQEAMKTINLEFSNGWNETYKQTNINFYSGLGNAAESITGYDWALQVSVTQGARQFFEVMPLNAPAKPTGDAMPSQEKKDKFELELNSKEGTLLIYRQKHTPIKFDLRESIQQMETISANNLHHPLLLKSADDRAMLVIQSANGSRRDAIQPFNLTNIMGRIYLKNRD